MTQILPTASYVRRRNADPARVQSLAEDEEFADPQVPLRVWDLLETPHTLESLRRSLGARQHDVDVRAVLEKLYHEDLIQISPDS